MKHYVLTRSAWSPQVSPAENRFRLGLLEGVTARSLAAQTCTDFTWLVLIDPADPLLTQRCAVLNGAGLHVQIAEAGNMRLRHRFDKPTGPWAEHIDWGRGPILTTRLDDDDALARTAVAALQSAAAHTRQRTVLTLPWGWLAPGPHGTLIQVGNQWPICASLFAPAGQGAHIMQASHVRAYQLGPMRPATLSPSWLYTRLGFNRSGPGAYRRHLAGHPLGPPPRPVRRAFDIDWAALATREDT